jgi:8-oxo-dGTP pyrophosphatase MutT (NUDIX family)
MKRKYSGALLITDSGSVLLQQRDKNPGIINPGMITTFGGTFEEGEEPMECVIRELKEETNLDPKAEDLLFYDTFEKTEPDGSDTEIYMFEFKIGSTEGLEIYEGEGYVEFNKEDDLSKYNLSELARKILSSYFEKQ